MKKIYVLFVAALAAASAFAVLMPITGGIDEECKEFGFDYGIEKFEWKNGYVLEEDNPDYDIVVEGDAARGDWSSYPAVDGVIIKGANNYFAYDGGVSGSVYSTDTDDKEISHVTFCGKEDVIPEFSLVAGGLALIGAAAGYALLRRK